MNAVSISVRVNAGEELPRFYGIAWRDYARRQTVCMPVPLNIVCSVARDLWWALAAGHSAKDAYIGEQVRVASERGFERGRAAGYTDGRVDGWNRAFQTMKQVIGNRDA